MHSTLEFKEYNKKVVGQPKYNWWIKGIEAYWEYLTENYQTPYKNVEFKWEAKHLQFIEYAALASWGLDKHELTEEQFYATIEGKELEEKEAREEKMKKESTDFIENRRIITSRLVSTGQRPGINLAIEYRAAREREQSEEKCSGM